MDALYLWLPALLLGVFYWLDRRRKRSARADPRSSPFMRRTLSYEVKYIVEPHWLEIFKTLVDEVEDYRDMRCLGIFRLFLGTFDREDERASLIETLKDQGITAFDSEQLFLKYSCVYFRFTYHHTSHVKEI